LNNRKFLDVSHNRLPEFKDTALKTGILAGLFQRRRAGGILLSVKRGLEEIRIMGNTSDDFLDGSQAGPAHHLRSLKV
jgi:hypothetical protein